MIDLPAQYRIPGGIILFVESVYLGQVWFFLCPVEGAVLLGAFEQQVFEVMGKTGVITRVCIAAGPDGDANGDTRLFVVGAEQDGKPVGQRIHPGLHRVVGYISISVTA